MCLLKKLVGKLEAQFAVEILVVETPAVETLAVERLAVETFAVETLVAETPAVAEKPAVAETTVALVQREQAPLWTADSG